MMQLARGVRLPNFSSSHHLLIPILPSLLALFLYISTLAPGVLGGDAGELQFAPAILSLPHPSGYPVQVLLDRLWLVVFPFGSTAWRLNLFSALITAAAVGVVTWAVARSTASQLAGLAAGVLLAIAPVVWSQAVLADKYALNGLLTALLLAAALRFDRRGDRSSLLWLAFAGGWAVAHHRSLWLFGPVIAAWVLWRGWPLLRRPANWLWAILCAAAPLLTYLYLPWAAGRLLPPAFGMTMDWDRFRHFVFSDGSAGQVRWTPDVPGLVLYLERLTESYPLPWLIVPAAALAFFLLRHGERRRLIFLVLAFAAAAYLSAVYENYDLPRRYVYFVPSYVCLALLIGEVVGRFRWWNRTRIEADIAAKNPPRSARSAQSAFYSTALLLFALLPLLALPARWQAFRAEQAQEQPLDIWRQSLKAGGQADRLALGLRLVAPNALVAGDWEQATPLWYAQSVDGVCPDCRIAYPLHELIDFAALAAQEGRPLYVARTVNDAATWSHPRAAGPLVELGAAAQMTLPAGLLPLDLRFDGHLALAGYLLPLGEPVYARGRVLPLSLVWQRAEDGDPLPDYAMSLRLEGPGGEVWKADAPAPVLGMHPFSAFEPGEVVTDYVEVPIPAGAAAGEYMLRVIVYMVEGGVFRNAEVSGGDGVILRFRVEG